MTAVIYVNGVWFPGDMEIFNTLCRHVHTVSWDHINSCLVGTGDTFLANKAVKYEADYTLKLQLHGYSFALHASLWQLFYTSFVTSLFLLEPLMMTITLTKMITENCKVT
jgi:hypothetical protein